MLTFKQMGAAGSILLLCSCSPKVTSVVQASYPALGAEIPVRVFESGAPVPAGAETLGQFSIADGGFATQCGYPAVLKAAKGEARKIGGNGLYITEHIYPDLWSSCHRIAGDVLRLPEGETADTAGTQAPSPSTGIRELPAAKGLDWSAEPMETPVRREIGRNRIPRFDISANIGYGWILNRSAGLYGSLKQSENELSSGLAWDIRFHNYVGSAGIGWGIAYSGYVSQTSYAGMDIRAMLGFVGPIACLKTGIGGRWMFLMDAGIGYMGFGMRASRNPVSAKTTGSAFGGLVALGLEYRCTEYIGVGFDLNLTGGAFSKLKQPNGSYLSFDNGEKMGATRISTLLGLRVYFGN